MRYPIIQQHDATDCGPACLSMIGAFHGRRLSLAVLREMAATDRHGTTLAGLITAAEAAGFTARPVRATPDALAKLPAPSIAHWHNHYVVLYKLTRRHAIIGDPAAGLRRLPLEEFHKHWTGVLLLLSPSPALRANVQSPSSFARLVRLLHPHRRLFMDALLAAVLMTLLALTSSFFIQALVDFVFVLGRKPTLNLLTLGMLLVLCARTAFQALRTYLLAHLSLRVDAETVLGFHRHLLGLPLPFFLRRKAGEILSRMNDAIKIRVAVTAATLSIIVDGLLVTITAAVMFWLDWRLAAASLGLTPLLAGVIWFTNKPMKRYQRLAMERAAEVEGIAVETLGAIQTIKACRAEARVQSRTEARFTEMLEANYRTQVLSLGAGVASTLAAGLSTLSLLWVGGRFVLDGDVSVGRLMAFYSLLGTVLGPVERLANVNQPILDAVVAGDRLGEILELDTELSRQRASAIDRRIDGAIEFSDVSYRYGPKNVTFRVDAGECVGIAGESGCGKTTLVNLLCRFLEPVSGRISIDGIDVMDYTLECLRREIAVVPQDIVLMNGSLAENIRFAVPGATPADIRAAGRLARLDAVAGKLPLGYDTIVGERGMSLSGGERQRVAIARALLAAPAILVLDEPTAHLDAESAVAVEEILDSRRGLRTTIVISHHPLGVDRTVEVSRESNKERATASEIGVGVVGGGGVRCSQSPPFQGGD